MSCTQRLCRAVPTTLGCCRTQAVVFHVLEALRSCGSPLRTAAPDAKHGDGDRRTSLSSVGTPSACSVLSQTPASVARYSTTAWIEGVNRDRPTAHFPDFAVKIYASEALLREKCSPPLLTQ